MYTILEKSSHEFSDVKSNVPNKRKLIGILMR